jgi:hypothetical protein
MYLRSVYKLNRDYCQTGFLTCFCVANARSFLILLTYEAQPESKITIFFKSDTVNELPVHNFILNIVASIVQTFIKSWNQLPYPRVTEVRRLHFEPRHDFFLHLIIVIEIFLSEIFL